jgi:ketosteroid isomerase-like protein
VAVPHPREEVEAAVARYVEVRERMDRNEGGWEEMTALFTDDATYIDPAWGRIDGIDALRDFLRDSMAGLEDWQFPIEWIAIDGDHVVVKWIQRLPGQRADGSTYDNSGVSLLTYAGGGRFSSSEDHLNMLHVYEVIAESGWRPGKDFQNPPEHPRRL